MSNNQKKHSAKKMKPSKHFTVINKGIQDATATFESGEKLTFDRAKLPAEPASMTAKEIIKFRKERLNVSQHVFAAFLNVSPRTVQAWEQKLNHPSGVALKLMRLIQEDPQVFKKAFI